jgi:hypothetical protein
VTDSPGTGGCSLSGLLTVAMWKECEFCVSRCFTSGMTGFQRIPGRECRLRPHGSAKSAIESSLVPSSTAFLPPPIEGEKSPRLSREPILGHFLLPVSHRDPCSFRNSGIMLDLHNDCHIHLLNFRPPPLSPSPSYTTPPYSNHLSSPLLDCVHSLISLLRGVGGFVKLHPH